MQFPLKPYTTAVVPFAYWDGGFSASELDWLQEKAACASTPGLTGRSKEVASDIRRSNISWLQNNNESLWVFEKLAHIVSTLNQQFFRLDITSFSEALQLTNYSSCNEGMYGWHQDFGAPGISRKLSVVIQLTDPSEYEGGNLQVFNSQEPKNVRKERGLVTVFPSYTVHQVTPVTQGNRQSLVGWVSGPAFR